MKHCSAFVVTATLVVWDSPAAAFPPYRSTDADTSDPWVLEARLGLVRATRMASDVELTAPLARLNLGLPRDIEVVSEAELDPSEPRLADAAAGGKWVPLTGAISFGTEVLALLPVSAAGGIGVEAQALISYRAAPWRLHANAGGFSDGRSDPSEHGWRASTLVELELGAARPGLELFARRVAGEPVQALIGLGSIADAGWLDIRLGVHAGVTDAAPDLVASFWLSTEIPLVSERE